MFYFFVYLSYFHLKRSRKTIFAKIFLGFSVNETSIYRYLVKKKYFFTIFAASHIKALLSSRGIHGNPWLRPSLRNNL
jgi:hypothetical protein